jgi:hypothetical protein
VTTVESILMRLQDGQRRASELHSRIKDATLREYISKAESVFAIVADSLSAQRLAEPRSSTALQWWLNQTDRLLSPALSYVEYVEQIAAKFGDDVATF